MALLNKKCSKCGVPLTTENTYPSASKRQSWTCKSCCKKESRELYAKNREYMQQYFRQRRQKQQLNVLGISLIQCPLCEDKFRNWRGVSAHIFQRHKGRKFCAICHVELTPENAGDYNYQHANWCQVCRRKYHRERQRRLYRIPEEREKFRRRGNRHTDKLRNALLDSLGRKCVVCGFDNPLALAIDHINGNGAQERKQFHKGKHKTSPAYYRHILEKIKNGSQDYQILCSNCNTIKQRKIELERRNNALGKLRQ